MKFKKIVIILIFLLIIPAILAVVTRNMPDWICPLGFGVTLNKGQNSGAKNSYGAEETLGQSWDILGSSHSYTLKDILNLDDGIKQIAFFGIKPNEIIYYTLRMPAGSYSISGYYALDSSGQMPIGTTNFIVRENTCNKETEDDLDGDGFGIGCGCDFPLRRTDCDDDITDDVLPCPINPATYNPNTVDCNDNQYAECAKCINPGIDELVNNDVDENCDGCVYVDMDDDFYPTTSACGEVDCDEDTSNDPTNCNGGCPIDHLDCQDKISNDGDCAKCAICINPGKPELNCDNVNNNCANEACPYTGVNGDCCPSTLNTDFSYYDQNCDCNVDDNKKNDFINNWLLGIVDAPLLKVIEAIPSGYSNP